MTPLNIVYTAPLHGAEGFEERCHRAGISSTRVGHSNEFSQYPDAGLFIDGAFDGTFGIVPAPLLVHCPHLTLSSLKNAPRQIARFCAWPGFWESNTWEMATAVENEDLFKGILAELGIKALPVADIAGLIAPRILCTLINEAAYTLADGIATAADIDTAMKLGTNYPFGPVEWARKIGIEGIKKVLDAMAVENERYLPHAELHRLAGHL